MSVIIDKRGYFILQYGAIIDIYNCVLYWYYWVDIGFLHVSYIGKLRTH